jgi:hypothetical protein
MKIAFKRIQPLVFIEVAFLLLVLNGCNLQPPGKRFSDPASFTTINISDIQDNQFIINDIINSVKFIPLEFKDECLIHSILKLDFYNDTIFILSRDGLYLFNTEGKYICQIGNKGQGPGEYILPFDFSIDKQNKQAIIYDSNKSKIQIYDLSGNFLKSVQIGMSWNIEPFGNDLFLNYPMNIMGDQPYCLMIVNQNGDTIKTFNNKFKFELLGTPFLVPVIGAMYKFQNNIHFKQFLSDTLYVFNSKSLKIIPKYVFQGMKNLPTRMLGNIEQYNKEAINYSWLDRILETENYLFIRLNSYGKSEYMIYDKNKKKLYSVQTDIKNDIQTKRINLSTFFWPNYKLSDNIIIKPWTAYRFKKDFNDVVSDKESMAILTEYGLDNFFQFYESVNENDNPIIQIIFLK